MSIKIIELMRGMIPANQNLVKPPTLAEKIIALESISDSKVRERAIASYFRRESSSYALAVFFLFAVISTSTYAVFGPLPMTYKGGFITLLVGIGWKLMKYVFSQ
jgi:hypothetical protein